RNRQSCRGRNYLLFGTPTTLKSNWYLIPSESEAAKQRCGPSRLAKCRPILFCLTLFFINCGGNGTPTATLPTTSSPSTTRTIGLSGNLAFGNVVVLFASEPRTLTITNSGNSTLAVTNLRFSGNATGVIFQ